MKEAKEKCIPLYMYMAAHLPDLAHALNKSLQQ